MPADDAPAALRPKTIAARVGIMAGIPGAGPEVIGAALPSRNHGSRGARAVPMTLRPARARVRPPGMKATP